jgi:hypothetical protein
MPSMAQLLLLLGGSIVAFRSGPNVIILFTAVIYEFS